MSTAPITLRRAAPGDRDAVIAVEAGSTPGLRYVARVFDDFVADARGEFTVAELGGAIVGCAKLTRLADGSAWLETLRVAPAFQGLGVGKRLYEGFFAFARREGISTMRMYTGVTNAASKGLAERFGFRLAGTFRGAGRPLEPATVRAQPSSFVQVTDPARAAALLLPHHEAWAGFVVMNRTFYALGPDLCADFARAGRVYEDAATGSIVVAGARFMPEQALHIACFAGDAPACLDFAAQLSLARGAGRLSCLFPSAAAGLQATLTGHGFGLESSDFIVMESA